MIEWCPSPAQPMMVNGVALEYACYGPPPTQAPTLVLLHEGLGCVAAWRDFPATLSAETGLGVLVYSRQGYGQSDPVDLPRPPDYMTREAVDVLPYVLDRAEIQHCILLGHSDGATIAAIYAGSVADHRVRGLILEAPHFFLEEIGLTEIARACDSFQSSGLRARMARLHKDPVGAFRGWGETWLSPAFRGWNVADVIDYIRVPILAIQGANDQYGTMAQIEEIETRAYCPVDREVLDCRHVPHLEAPEATLRIVADYCVRLQRIEAAASAPA